MDAKDEKIRLEILELLHEAFKNNPGNPHISNDELSESLVGTDEKDINYILDRIDGDYAEIQTYLGGGKRAEITARGVEYLSKQGHPTFLDTETRYALLELLYTSDRENRRVGLSINQLVEQMGVDHSTILRNVRYLKQKNILDLRGGFGGNSTVQLTNHGRERWEAYRDDGVEIPSTTLSESTRQAEIGRGDRSKAEHLFRDIVELSQEEVVVLDRYAKKELFEWLEGYVPRGVQVRVLTSSVVTGGSYTEEVYEVLSNSDTVEVRELSNSDWDFHDRYVFRDDDMGWSWGHSFHDSGDRQHTANELKPINRDKILEKFENAWEQAESVRLNET